MGKSSVYEEFFRELCRALVVKAIALLIGRSGSWFKSVAKKAREDFETGNYSQEEILRIVSVIYVGTIFLCLFSAGIVVGIYKMRKKLLMLLPLLERFMMLYFVQNLATDFADNVISGFCQSIFSLALPVSLYSGTKVKGVWTSGLCVLTEVICFLWGPGVVAGIFCTLDVVETVDEFEIFVLMRAIKFICSVSWSWTMDQCGDQILHLGSNTLAALGVGDVESYLDAKQRYWLLELFSLKYFASVCSLVRCGAGCLGFIDNRSS